MNIFLYLWEENHPMGLRIVPKRELDSTYVRCLLRSQCSYILKETIRSQCIYFLKETR